MDLSSPTSFVRSKTRTVQSLEGCKEHQVVLLQHSGSGNPERALVLKWSSVVRIFVFLKLQIHYENMLLFRSQVWDTGLLQMVHSSYGGYDLFHAPAAV